MSATGSQSRYVIMGVSAFAFWGLSPIYYKWVQSVPAFELMAHRVVWSVLFLLLYMMLVKKAIKLKMILTSPKLLVGLSLSSLMIAINWSLYVWANVTNQVLAASLGYFINPLVSVLLGVLFLNERLTAKQLIAFSLVLLAVANMIFQVGKLPWLSLTLAITFGLYGLIRKQLEIDSFNGLLFEALLVSPLAFGYLWYLSGTPELAFSNHGLAFDSLIILSGLITLLPLIFFAASVKGIKLSTVGFIQYLAPSLSFLLAVYVFDEPFSFSKLISFALIWLALILISFDAWRRHRASRV